MLLILGLLAGYLCGSIPFGLVLTRLGGAGDIRGIGSGNIGATNVLRTGRRGLALATLAFDIAKGALPVVAAWWLAGPQVAAMTGAGAVIGHCFPVWLGFKGGKGVATAAGVMLGFSPLVLLPSLALFIAAFWATRFVSLGSILAAVTAPLAALVMGNQPAVWLYLVIAAIVIFQHRANIQRLLAGTETRTSLAKKG